MMECAELRYNFNPVVKERSLVKTEKIELDLTEQPSANAWLIGFVSWLLPGAGHLWLKRWWRAAGLGGAVWLSFFLGLWMGGKFFGFSGTQGTSALLQVLPIIANLGSGAPYLFCVLAGMGFLDDPREAARATYEYGNTFLLIAGLLNYLNVLDAFDIAVGRKP